MGYMSSDPDCKTFNSGKTKCSFSLGINAGKETTWIDVECWDNIAKNCSKILKKGSLVFVEGKLNLNSWVSKDGTKKSKIFCKADVVTFLNSETQKPKRENQNQEALSKQDFTEEDEELANIPF